MPSRLPPIRAGARWGQRERPTTWSACAPAAGIGHLQRLDRRQARELVAAGGLTVACELSDPLPASVHLFFAATIRARAAALAKWALRASLHELARPLALRLFTVHYACLCLAPGPSRQSAPGAQR